MQHSLKHWWNGVPSKGGLIGAITGIFVASGSHNESDGTAKKAGKTTLFAGAGFLAGNWVEKLLKKL
jgi:hypothetical protein